MPACSVCCSVLQLGIAVHAWPAATPHCPCHYNLVEPVFCPAVCREHWPAHRRGHLWLQAVRGGGLWAASFALASSTLLCCAPIWLVSLSRAVHMQVWVGRLAMAGFLSAIIGEFITGGRYLECWPAALLTWSAPPGVKVSTLISAEGTAPSLHWPHNSLLPSVWPCTRRALTCAACHALVQLPMCVSKGPLVQTGLICPLTPAHH